VGELDAAGSPVMAGRSRRLVRATAALVIAVICSAHVGTFDVFFAGKAGPYDVQISVRPPGVIPGLAQISVRVAGDGVRRVTTQAAQWNLGTRGAPAPDVAEPVDGAPGLYASQLWLMTSSSYAINVAVEGTRGTGRTVIPVTAVATKRLPMMPGLGWALAGMGLFLTVGALSIVRSAAAESTLAPGESPDRARLWRGRSAAAASAVVLGALLFGGWRWWTGVDGGYARRMFRPLDAKATVNATADGRVLKLSIVDGRWARREMSPFVPDHGKLVHLFLVGIPGMNALAHLHPTMVDSATFLAPVGSLPAGRYRFYADVVHESGFAQTLSGETDVTTAIPSDRLTDADDAIWTGSAPAGDTVALGDLTVAWRRSGGLVAGDDAMLAFSVATKDGSPAELEQYLGMPAHAVVARDDGSVFVHLHAGGSFAMASQQVLEAIQRGDTLPSVRAGASPRAVIGHHQAASQQSAPRWRGDSLTFPFAFPSPGRYRIWIQVKRDGAVRTAAFDAVVSPKAVE
jgi:hypothetical protein